MGRGPRTGEGGGEALDLALGLMRAPALRTALQARPLPAGMGELLAIASGSTTAAAAAAVRSGHAETELVEATRFFVQQVLLADDADAYRVLGAGRDAGQATLRDHHRMLQRWLHPDRSPGADWESALSTRVNQAWNHLRNESARRQYDSGLPPVATGGSAAAAGPLLRDVVSASATPAAAMGMNHRGPTWSTYAAPVFVTLLSMLCVALAWLAVTRDDRFEDSDLRPRRSGPQAVVSGIEAPPGSTGHGTPVAGTGATPGAPSAPERPDHEVQLPALVPPARVSLEQPGFEGFESALLPDIDVQPVSASRPEDPVPMPAASHREDPVAVPATVAPATPAIASLREPDQGRTPVVSAELPAAPAPAPADAARPAVPAPPTPAPQPVATAPRPVAEPIAPEDPLQLLSEAEDAIRSVTAYLAGTGTEPVWLDLPISLEAAALRNALLARHEDRPQPRIEVAGPDWTLGTAAASMTGAYRLQARRRTLESGLIKVDLTRRDQHWRVRAVRLEPVP